MFCAAVSAKSIAWPPQSLWRSSVSGQFLRVVGPTALALLLCNMDRIVMSVAIVPMAQEFGWSPSIQASFALRTTAHLSPKRKLADVGDFLITPPSLLQGIVQSAFLWGYVCTAFLGGALADKYGGKVVMASGILWFSLASLLLPAASTSAVCPGKTLALRHQLPVVCSCYQIDSSEAAP